MAYCDFMIFTVPEARKSEYLDMAKIAGRILVECGANRVLETVQDDVPHGKQTDFYRAVDAKEGDLLFASIVEWPSKEAREEGNKKFMAHPEINIDKDWIFNMNTVIFGGFTKAIETNA